MSWVEEELKELALGDERLNRRLRRMVYDFSAQPMASVPQASGTWAATKAAYRFWSSDQVTSTAILAGHVAQARERIRPHGTVLALQDTTELDFTTHRSMRGRGPLSFPAYQGLRVHSLLATSAQGVPLGLMHQHVWARAEASDAPKAPLRQRPTREKESQRWLDTVEVAAAAVPSATQVVVVADREADIFDLFAMERGAHVDLLIRSTYNRRVSQDEGHIWETLRAQPVAGTYEISVGRRGDEPARTAILQVRFTMVNVRPPHQGKPKEDLPPVEMYAILVEEVAPPEGAPPILWWLLTTLPIADFDAAVQAVRWYSYRWLIERYHFVLKSGCRIEALQLTSAAQIEKALATYAIVAWRLLWLVYQARTQPDAPATDALEDAEWHALYATIHRTNLPPSSPPTLAQAVRWIAQLGGFLARKSDGEPGVKTLWLGLRRLHDLADSWRLFHPTQDPSSTYG